MKKFFANIRQKLFTARIDMEIFNRIAAHINGEKNHGYPFDSTDALAKLSIRGNHDALLNLDIIEQTAAKMPKAYGNAFRYIAYRDLNKRMKMYLELAERRVQPKACDPRFVARHA
jgi:hypothetical protein